MMVASYRRAHVRNHLLLYKRVLMTYHIDEKPVFVNGILIEEEKRAGEALSEEVGCKSRKPMEQVEAGAGLEHEEGYRLLDEQPNDDGLPLDVRSVSRGCPKAKLEDKKTQYGNGAVTVICALM
jgi:hypothetical protein